MENLKDAAKSIKKIAKGIKRNNTKIELLISYLKGYEGKPDYKEENEALTAAKKTCNELPVLYKRKRDRLNKAYTLLQTIFESIGIDSSKKFDRDDLTEEEEDSLTRGRKKAQKEARDNEITGFLKEKMDAYTATVGSKIGEYFTRKQWDIVLSIQNELDELKGENFQVDGKVFEYKMIKIKVEETSEFD